MIVNVEEIEMKVQIIKYKKGFLNEGHTFYRLELHAENKKENELLTKLNSQFIVWVSPNKSKNKMSWWGKK